MQYAVLQYSIQYSSAVQCSSFTVQYSMFFLLLVSLSLGLARSNNKKQKSAAWYDLGQLDWSQYLGMK